MNRSVTCGLASGSGLAGMRAAACNVEPAWAVISIFVRMPRPPLSATMGVLESVCAATGPGQSPSPRNLDPGAAGPLLCGGITVFSPLLLYGIRPTARVGVVGIGGLGHMALKFLKAWGCEVTAFTSSESKREEARLLGAHHVVSSRDSRSMQGIAGFLDLIIATVNVPLDWPALMATLAPKGRLHMVGAVLEPIPVNAMSLLLGQQEVSGSPTGSPSAIGIMLDFAARHHIEPQVEHFPMSQVNDAFDHLRAGKAHYRIVLDADFA